jgi:tryptophan synthase beta chain
MTEVRSSQPLTEPTGTVVPSTVPTHWYNLAADLPRTWPRSSRWP